jgi:hypothetical protein
MAGAFQEQLGAVSGLPLPSERRCCPCTTVFPRRTGSLPAHEASPYAATSPQTGRVGENRELLGRVVLKTIMNIEHDLALTPSETCAGILALDSLLGNQPVAQHGADHLQRRARVVLLGHAIDGDLSALFVIEDMNDEDFFVSVNAVRGNPECFPLIGKFAYHVSCPLFV